MRRRLDHAHQRQCGFLPLELFLGHLGIAQDDREQIVEVVGDAARELAHRLHLLRLPELLFGRHALGHVAADEEVLLLRLGPCAHPGQGHDVAFLVHIAAIEVAHAAAVPRQSHLRPRPLEIGRIDEVGGAAPDHLLGLVAEDRPRARADPHEFALAVDDQDQILGGVEDALVDRARDLPLPLSVQSGAMARARLGHVAEEDRVAARMRVAANLEPGVEQGRMRAEGDHLAGRFGGDIGGLDPIPGAGGRIPEDRRADELVGLPAPNLLGDDMDVSEAPAVVDGDEAVPP